LLIFGTDSQADLTLAVSELKHKTVRGFFWSSMESVLSQGMGIVFGVILARLLSPGEFGLLGMITIFISVAQVFVDSGLSQSLIRKQDCSPADYSTVFWVNLFIGTVCYILIWAGAPFIAWFYGKPELVSLTRVTALAIIIGSVTLIQQTILTKELDFKTLTKSSVSGTLVSGVVSIILAFSGYGVWSLVWRTIINQAVRSAILWYRKKWWPGFFLGKRILKDHFAFGSNILIISIVAALYKNFYNLIIGKNYSDKVLGYYTNADQYSLMPSSTISNITNKVSYPVLSGMQDDDARLRSGIQKLVTIVMYISFTVMFGLAALAKPLFVLVLGEKWLPSVILFQALCIAYAISPMHVINQNIMKIKGRSDLFLKTEIIKYLVFTPLLIFGALYGMTVLILGIIVFYWSGFVINGLYSKRLLDYSFTSQAADFLPAMTLALLPAAAVWSLGFFTSLGTVTLLAVQVVAYPSLIILLSVIFRIPAFFELIGILKDRLTVDNLLNTIKKQ
jgi:O-antigen/teichoic acid export membrane protein